MDFQIFINNMVTKFGAGTESMMAITSAPSQVVFWLLSSKLFYYNYNLQEYTRLKNNNSLYT